MNVRHCARGERSRVCLIKRPAAVVILLLRLLAIKRANVMDSDKIGNPRVTLPRPCLRD